MQLADALVTGNRPNGQCKDHFLVVRHI